MILNAENSANIDDIPKNTKLSPIKIDTSPVLKIGQNIKILRILYVFIEKLLIFAA